MDCKEFSTRHAAFIDDTLPGFQMAAMREHVTTCARCSRRDAEIRRSLFLLKNLPPVEVSDGFQDRLRARITAEGPAYHRAPGSNAGVMKWVAAAAMLVVLAGTKGWYDSARFAAAPVRLPAVFASAPVTYEGGDESAPAYVASMSTGIPMWPALMLAEEGPLRFAGMQTASWQATRPD
jgi:anti-sigma factor RsiW